MDYQRLLLDHLDLVDQIVRTTGRRRHLSATELDDFASFVNLRLIEDDYAILRKFQNRSTLWTYLSAVIERLSLDFCAEKWGRWRPSAMAERLGPVAVVLERLVTRDSHTIEEAMEIMRTNHDVGLTYAELLKLWDQLPVRVAHDRGRRGSGRHGQRQRHSETQRRRCRTPRSIERLAARTAGSVRTNRRARSRADRATIRSGPFDGRDRQTHRQFGADASPAARQEREAIAAGALARRASIRAEIADLIGHPSIALSPLLRAEVEKFLGPVRLSKRDG